MAKFTPREILVVDLECTCWDDNTKRPQGQEMDVIEVGLCRVSFGNFGWSIQRKPSFIVKPTTSEVSEFCTKLTGLDKNVVQAGENFVDTCKILRKKEWNEPLFVSWGDFDRLQFVRQCEREGIKYPFGRRHLNAKTLFSIIHCLEKEVSVGEALQLIGKEFEGHPHSGADDAYNIARLLVDTIDR